MADFSLAAAIAGMTALLGAAVALGDYLRKERWRKAELAAQLIERIASDDELALARQVLDWGFGPLFVPKRYRILLEDFAASEPRSAAQRGEVMPLKVENVVIAMKPRIAFHPDLNKEAYIIRTCFDKFFDHLDHIYSLLKLKQIHQDDLDPLKYWLRQIADYRYAGDKEGDLVFQPFVLYSDFDYSGVVSLGLKLGVGGWIAVSRSDMRADALSTYLSEEIRPSG